MKRFLVFGLVVAATLLVGCPINQNPSNITVEDVLGEWDFINVTIKDKTYDKVHVSIIPAPHDPESSYKNGVDLHIGDCFYMSDGDFSGNVYTGEYLYKETSDSDWTTEPQDITVTFSLIDDKLQIHIEAGEPFGSFTIQGGIKIPQLTAAGFEQVEGIWEFTDVWILNQPEEVGGGSLLTTCTLKISEEHLSEESWIKKIDLEGVDQNNNFCKYFGQIIPGEENNIFEYSYYYSIKDAQDNNIAPSSDPSPNQTIEVKFFMGDGKLFAEFDGDGPLDGVRLYNGVKQL
jgi:hypothetical protein